LGDAEKRAFLDLIASTPVDQFRPCDLPLLARWSELCVMAERAAKVMEIEGMVTADGKPSAHFTIHKEATRGLNNLALRLRLGPQSRAHKAPRQKVGTVSYYERMELEGHRDDEEADAH
jgi:hypothetical protein